MKGKTVDQSIEVQDVESIEDWSTLSNLFWFHNSEDVAIASMMKIIEKKQITSLLNDPPRKHYHDRLLKLGSVGIVNITKPEILYWIALRNPIQELKKLAINQIHEEIHLIELLIRISNDAWNQLVQKISFSGLITVIEKSKDFNLIIHILHQIKRLDLIPQVIDMKSNYPEIAKRLLNTISDQEILTQIALNSKITTIRKKAISMIRDETILKEIAEFSDKLAIVLFTLSKISDQEYLKETAICNPTSPIAETAMSNIHDQEWFREIFEQYGELQHIGKLAFKRITDEYWLMGYITRKFPHLDRYFLLQASQKLRDSDNLTKFAALARLHGYHEIAQSIQERHMK